MSDIFEKLAAARQAFPDDIERIEADEKRIRELLVMKEYASLPESQTLIAMCRAQVVTARVRLATVREMLPEVRDSWWHVIESRGWILQMLAKDFEGELAQIERDLEAELDR